MVNRCVAKVISMLSRPRKFILRDQHLTTETREHVGCGIIECYEARSICPLYFDKWTSEWHPWNLCIITFAKRQKRASNIKMTGNRCRHMVQEKLQWKNNDKVYANYEKFQNFSSFICIFFTSGKTEHEPEWQLLCIWKIQSRYDNVEMFHRSEKLASLCLLKYLLNALWIEVLSNFCNNNNYSKSQASEWWTDFFHSH